MTDEFLKIRKNTLKGCRKNNNRKKEKKRVSGRRVSSIIFHRNCRRINSLSPEDRDQMMMNH